LGCPLFKSAFPFEGFDAGEGKFLFWDYFMDGYLTRFVNSVNIAILYRCIRKLVCGQISRIILISAHAFALPEFGSAYVHLQACCSAAARSDFGTRRDFSTGFRRCLRNLRPEA
jgi:hypothetical protein